MSTDFTVLASALAGGLPELRACLLVSRDGLALGSHPADEEARTLGAWARIAALGDVERGFVVVGEELWTFCRRGSYSAIAISNAGARPGIILDGLDQMLLVAEESRTRRDAVRPGSPKEMAPMEAPRGPRTSLHGDARPAGNREPAPTGSAGPPEHEPAAPAEAPAPDTDSPERQPSRAELDPLSLAREFHGLVEE